jgi:hypothetical protein
LDISLSLLPCAGVEDELYSADTKAPAIAQQVPPSASSIDVDAVR